MDSPCYGFALLCILLILILLTPSSPILRLARCPLDCSSYSLSAMPFKQKHIHSRLHQHDATDSTAPSSLPIDASTRLPVASSSTSSSSFISAGSQMNNNDQDDDLSTLSADDNDDDSQDPVNSTTIFKNRDAFEAYARVRFAATTQPTSRGAEKKNTWASIS